MVTSQRTQAGPSIASSTTAAAADADDRGHCCPPEPGVCIQRQVSADAMDPQPVLGHSDPAAGLQLMPRAAVGAPPGLAVGALEDGEYCMHLVGGDMTWSTSLQLFWSCQSYGITNSLILCSSWLTCVLALSTTAADLASFTSGEQQPPSRPCH